MGGASIIIKRYRIMVGSMSWAGLVVAILTVIKMMCGPRRMVKTGVRETDDAGWTQRYSHQALSHNGRLYVLGGYGYPPIVNDPSAGRICVVQAYRCYPDYLNDVWSSADGKNWMQETDDAEWFRRSWHQAVVFPPNLVLSSLPTTYEIILPNEHIGIIYTFKAQYGDGNYTYKLLPDISGFLLSANGELSTNGTAATGEHTITVQVADGVGQTATWTGKVIII